MLAERGLCLLKSCRTRSIATLFQYDFTTIGIRDLVSNFSNYRAFAQHVFAQGCSDGGMCPHDAAKHA
jgi:hypothetical protein